MIIQVLAVQLEFLIAGTQQHPEHTGPIPIESVSGNFILNLTQNQDSIVEKDSRECDRTDTTGKCECRMDFHGAAILDEDGNEIPITEEMIRNACRCLQESWHFPRVSDAIRNKEAATTPVSPSGQDGES